VEQLDLRSRRNYDRYMRVTKGFVDPDSPERAQWQRESAEDVVRTPHGINVMALFPVARGFSIGKR
jgi:hypothetical protein